jgi:hypothetical protein
MVRVLGAGILCAGISDAEPQQRGFYFEMPLQFELAVESGLVVSDPLAATDLRIRDVALREIDDVVGIVQPAAPSFRILHRRLELAATYRPEVELFLINREQSALNHTAGFLFEFRLTPRLTLAAGDAYYRTYDPSRLLGPATFLMGRGLLVQNSLYGTLGFRASPRTDLGFRFDTVSSSLDFGPVAILPEQVNRFWTGTLTHRLTRSDEISVIYSLLHAQAPGAAVLLEAPDEQTRAGALGFRGYSHSFTVGYSRTLSRAVTLGTSGGLIRDALTTHYTMSAGLEARIAKLRLTGGYDRGLSHAALERFPGAPPPGFQNDLAPASLLQSVTVRLEGELAPRVRLDSQYWRAIRTPALITAVGNVPLEGTSFWARFRLDFWVAETTALFAGYESLGQDETIFAGVPIHRRRFMTGIRLGISPRSPEPAIPLEGK